MTKSNFSDPVDRLVSVIVPTRNSERSIEACLSSIRRQSYPHIELVVVDNGSTDRTVEIASAHADIVVTSPGLRTRARNTGVRASSGHYVLNFDSDMNMPPDMVAECVALTSERYNAVILSEVNVTTGFWMAAYSMTKNRYSHHEGQGGIRFLERAIFEAVGGYDERLEAGEDFDLHYRLLRRGAVVTRTQSTVLHDVRQMRITDVFQKQAMYNATLHRFIDANRGQVKSNRGFYLRTIPRDWRLLVLSPHLVVGWVIVNGLLKCQQVLARSRGAGS